MADSPADYAAGAHAAHEHEVVEQYVHDHERELHDAAHGHGSTPAAWTAVGIAFLGFAIGCVAVVLLNWTLLAVAFVVLALALVVGKVMSMMGYGAQTDRVASPSVEG
jgi:nitric oxide reductase large subunit